MIRKEKTWRIKQKAPNKRKAERQNISKEKKMKEAASLLPEERGRGRKISLLIEFTSVPSDTKLDEIRKDTLHSLREEGNKKGKEVFKTATVTEFKGKEEEEGSEKTSREDKKRKEILASVASRQKLEFKNQPATVFFNNKISEFLSDEKKTSDEKVSLINNADSKFKKQNHRLDKNFWVLLDEEMFSKNKVTFEKEKIKNSKALGLLSVVASGAAFDKKVFQKTIEVYNDAYETKDKSLLSVVNHEKSNLLHVVCSVLASKSEESEIRKSDWEVYEFLKEECGNLLEEIDEYERKPFEFLEDAGIVVGEEKINFYAYFKE